MAHAAIVQRLRQSVLIADGAGPRRRLGEPLDTDGGIVPSYPDLPFQAEEIDGDSRSVDEWWRLLQRGKCIDETPTLDLDTGRKIRTAAPQLARLACSHRQSLQQSFCIVYPARCEQNLDMEQPQA
jgi:hypothetical protein